MSFDDSINTGGDSVLTGAQAPSNGGGAGAVHSVNPGTGITITGPATDPVVNNAGVLSENGQSGSVTNPVFCNGILTGALQLASLASAGFSEGALAWVSTVGALFRLQTASLTVDNVTVVAATGKGGFQWIRLIGENRVWQARTGSTAWTVDPAAGNDENDGTVGNPIKTLAEVARRTWKALYTVSTTVTLKSSAPSTDIGQWNVSTAPGAVFAFLGTGTSIYSGTITTATNVTAGPSTNDNEITDTGIPVSYTASGLLADGVIFNRTNGTSAWFYGLLDKGSKTLRTSYLVNTGSTKQTFANGDSYQALQLPQIFPQVFTTPVGLSVTATLLDLRGSWSTTATMPPIFYARCTFTQGASAWGPIFGFFRTCMFSGSTAVTFGGTPFSQGDLTFPTFRGFTLGVQFRRSPTSLQGPSFQGCGLIAFAGAYVFLTGTALDPCFYDGGNQPIFQVSDGSAVALEDNLGINASGFTGAILLTSTHGGGKITARSNPCIVGGSTSSGTPISVNGNLLPITALPTIPAGEQGGIYGPNPVAQPVANGVVTVGLGAFGPAGASATPTRWMQVPDGLGGFFTVPSYT